MIGFDGMGFPLVSLSAIGLEVMLLPITRTQFDFFLGDRTHFPTSALQDLDLVSPRLSWRMNRSDRLSGLLVSGIMADEAEAVARWIGNGFRLPSDAEWRGVDKAVGAIGTDIERLNRVIEDRRIHPAARAMIVRTVASTSVSWRAVGLFENGLLEWVRRPESGYGLQGRPRPDLLRVIHNPQAHDAIVPRMAGRHPAFGMRLVRSLNPPVP
jgi:hypothetical protein